MPRGTLQVLLVGANGLKNTDHLKKMDHYALLAVRAQVKKSSVALGQGSDPTWNDTLIFTITDGLEELSIKVLDSDVGDDALVGELTIPLEPSLFTGENIPVKEYSVKMGDEEKGKIKVGLSFFSEEMSFMSYNPDYLEHKAAMSAVKFVEVCVLDGKEIKRTETFETPESDFVESIAYFNKLVRYDTQPSDTLSITVEECDQDVVMNMMQIITGRPPISLSATLLTDLVLLADKYLITPCTSYCAKKLDHINMDKKLAADYIERVSKVEMSKEMVFLFETAKDCITSEYANLDRYSQEILDLPLTVFEIVLASGKAMSEDSVADLVSNYLLQNYSSVEERQIILTSNLCYYIRFSELTAGKMRSLLETAEFKVEVIFKVIVESLYLFDPTKTKRPYTYFPVQVVELKTTKIQTIVYMSLKRRECVKLLQDDHIMSQPFFVGKYEFRLRPMCYRHRKGAIANTFALYLVPRSRQKPVTISLTFSLLQPENKYKVVYKLTDKVSEGKHMGDSNLLNQLWENFISVNGKHFINDTLFIKADLVMEPNRFQGV